MLSSKVSWHHSHPHTQLLFNVHTTLQPTNTTMLLCHPPPKSPPKYRTSLTVCPPCPHRFSRPPAPSPSPEGQNRLQCRSCPTNFIHQKYLERRKTKRKEVENVIGGKHTWENVDKADNESILVFLRWGCFGWRRGRCTRVGLLGGVAGGEGGRDMG